MSTDKDKNTADIVGEHYRVGKRIAIGGHGTVFEGVDTWNDRPVALKFELVKTKKKPELRDEHGTYQALRGCSGVPQAYFFGLDPKRLHNFLVMDLLGPNLEVLFVRCGRRFTIKTVCMAAKQMVTLVEAVHEAGFVHRDISPENFLIDALGNEGAISIVDFGIAKRWQDPVTQQHIPYCEPNFFGGTTRYMSINAHKGRERSRRDDLESLGLVFIYFLRGGLPWQGIKGRDLMEKVGEKKQSIAIEELCEGLPEAFAIYLNCTRGLGFDETPDYDFLRELFNSHLKIIGDIDNRVYDWMRDVGTSRNVSTLQIKAGAVTKPGQSVGMNDSSKAQGEPSYTQPSSDMRPRNSLQSTSNQQLSSLVDLSIDDTGSGSVQHPAPSLGPDLLASPPNSLGIGGSQMGVYKMSEWEQFIPSTKCFTGIYRRKTTRANAYGGFSDVWICEAQTKNSTLKTVALKELRSVHVEYDSESGLRKMLKLLEREISVWARLDHPNVVPLLGFRLQPVMCLFSPWYTNGNARQWVKKHPDFGTRKLVEQVATGLLYLHSMKPPIAHGDIKADNVMINDQKDAVIIDFGLSQAIIDFSSALGQYDSRSFAGNPRWLAPEILRVEGCRRSTSSDVYAFGCLILEISTGDVPYAELSDTNVMNALTNGKPPVNDKAKYPKLKPNDPLWALMAHCWTCEPTNRPTMREVEIRLKQL